MIEHKRRVRNHWRNIKNNLRKVQREKEEEIQEREDNFISDNQNKLTNFLEIDEKVMEPLSLFSV